MAQERVREHRKRQRLLPVIADENPQGLVHFGIRPVPWHVGHFSPFIRPDPLQVGQVVGLDVMALMMAIWRLLMRQGAARASSSERRGTQVIEVSRLQFTTDTPSAA